MTETTDNHIPMKGRGSAHIVDDAVIQESRNVSEPEQYSGTSRKSTLPVDHGWAWFVMLGAFINATCILMFVRASSILFIHFQEKYQASATMTTLAFGLSTATSSLSTMLQPGVFLPRFTVRALALCGSIVNFLALVAIAFSPHIILVDVLYAVVGFFNSFLLVPQATLLGHYFHRHISFATAVASLGYSLGTIAGPPLIHFLIDIYGLQGAILIMAGITMNGAVGAMLLRPVSSYSSSPKSLQYHHKQFEKEDSLVVQANETFKSTYKDIDVKLEEEMLSLTFTDYCSPTDGLGSDFKQVGEKLSKTVMNMGEPFDTKGQNCDTDVYNTSKLSAVSTSSRSCLNGDANEASEINDSISSLSNPNGNSPPVLSKIGDKCQEIPQPWHEEHVVDTRKLRKSLSESSSEQAGSAMSVQSRSHNCVLRLKYACVHSKYNNPVVALLVATAGFGITTQTALNYMPALGQENGLTSEQIAFVLPVAGTSDLVSKLGVGLFADLKIVPRIYIACASQLFLGTLLQFTRFFRGFELMIVLQVLVGMVIGIFHSLVPVITVDTLGVDYISYVMAGYFVVNGAVLSLNHMIVGPLKDATSSFLVAYHYMGSLSLIAGMLLLTVPLVARLTPRVKDIGEKETPAISATSEDHRVS